MNKSKRESLHKQVWNKKAQTDKLETTNETRQIWKREMSKSKNENAQETRVGHGEKEKETNTLKKMIQTIQEQQVTKQNMESEGKKHGVTEMKY